MAYSNTPEAASGCCSLLLMLRKQKEDMVTLMHRKERGLGTLGRMAHQHPENEVSRTLGCPSPITTQKAQLECLYLREGF